VLTTLLLLRAGYGYVPYSSMEGVIETNKDSYYLALRRTQQNHSQRRTKLGTWLVFFLKTMAKQKDNLAAKVKEEQALRASLPALSRQILELVKTRKKSPSRRSRTRPRQPNTIKVHLKKLAEQHYWYRSAKDAALVTQSNRHLCAVFRICCNHTASIPDYAGL